MAERDPAIPTRSPGVSWDELMGQDSRPVPECLARDLFEPMGSAPLEASRYTSEDFARAERERMWPHVWQFAAREEDLPEPGDYVVYENAGRSWLIARQDDGSVRAFHNVCLHRGRKLSTEDGVADRSTCPFHGFTWNKDGSFIRCPAGGISNTSKATTCACPKAKSGAGAAISSCAKSRADQPCGIPRPAARTFQTLAA